MKEKVFIFFLNQIADDKSGCWQKYYIRLNALYPMVLKTYAEYPSKHLYVFVKLNVTKT